MTGPNVYRALGLTDDEYQEILKILKREPTPTELAMFSVEWSEHCGYRRSRLLFKHFPREGKYPTLVGEDAGGILLDNLAIVFKMESHNHPSQVEPKQGAATGVGGIIRDIFTTGARPVASLNSLRFGPLDNPKNQYLLKGVVDGIQFYGNCLGVPTIGGEIYFDETYSGNCLVNAMSIGIGQADKLARAQARGIGNSIMYVGSSTGRDGIGGCSVLASAEFKEGEEKRPTVQIGDPFTEKCLIEATLEALETGHITGIKDMGAAGLTCSSSEMADAGGVGIEIELAKVPRREAGMEPYEVMMSESQERMLACVKAGHEKEIKELFEKWDLNAEVIGIVTDDKHIRVKDNGQVVADIPTAALTNPTLCKMPTSKPGYLSKIEKCDFSKLPQPKDMGKTLLKLLSTPNIASKEWIFEQYDHMVQTNTIVLPGSDASVIRIKDTKMALAATTDCNSRYCYLDPYKGAQIAVAEAARNLTCSGADPAAVTDCLNFGNPEKPDRYWHFENCVKGAADACRAFQVPVISGNVSFYNESPAGAIYPTPTIGMVGVIKDAGKVTTQYFKKAGDEILLIGLNKDELGASEYLKVIHGQVKGPIPDLDLKLETQVQDFVRWAINKGLASSAHDASEGGLAVALAESCLDTRNPVGAAIELVNLGSPADRQTIRTDALLFGETQSRIIISASRKNAAAIKAAAKKKNIPLQVLGKTGGNNLKISIKHKGANKLSINLPVAELNKAFRNAIKKFVEVK